MPRGGAGGGGGGGRGRGKTTHKGGNRHFSNAEEIQRQQEDIRKRRERGDDDEGSDSGSNDDKPKGSGGRTVAFDASARPPPRAGKQPSSESESSSEESDEEEGKRKGGVQHLIQIDNPNRVKTKLLKTSQLDSLVAQPPPVDALSRKEREAIEAERAKQHYQQLHQAGKTDEAQKDLARLQIIRKQREEAAKKREADKIAKETAEAKATEAVKDAPAPKPKPGPGSRSARNKKKN